VPPGVWYTCDLLRVWGSGFMVYLSLSLSRSRPLSLSLSLSFSLSLALSLLSRYISLSLSLATKVPPGTVRVLNFEEPN